MPVSVLITDPLITDYFRRHFSPLTRSMYLSLVAERLKAKCRRVLLNGYAAKGRQKNEQKL
jgi:chromosome condensin MukBEF complex kleisin-like MukF subunit